MADEKSSSLTEEQKELLKNWEKLSKNKRKALMNLINEITD